ncbi:MAG: hypothetical protein J6C13_03710 [Clostridia bacterium]|nr:hypothetical protein [Clostridia bacterium]
MNKEQQEKRYVSTLHVLDRTTPPVYASYAADMRHVMSKEKAEEIRKQEQEAVQQK